MHLYDTYELYEHIIISSSHSTKHYRHERFVKMWCPQDQVINAKDRVLISIEFENGRFQHLDIGWPNESVAMKMFVSTIIGQHQANILIELPHSQLIYWLPTTDDASTNSGHFWNVLSLTTNCLTDSLGCLIDTDIDEMKEDCVCVVMIVSMIRLNGTYTLCALLSRIVHIFDLHKIRNAIRQHKQKNGKKTEEIKR